VPLDYQNEAAGTTHVSFMKWCSNSTSANSTTQDILLNPGGPGGSGISLLQSSLSLFQTAIGTGYNFVGFDPRGVNNSGPNLSCFPGGERGTSRLYTDLSDPMDASDKKSYGEVYARSAAFGDFCTAAHSAANDTAKYANTVATATDMLRYTEILAKSNGQDAQKSQLWYYGMSYGTVLGTTFAALFPDRVGRIVVDGVVDGEDYYQGKWLANIPDADKAFRYFFQTCYDAGKGGKCSFWADSPAKIESRYQALLDDLELHPIPVTLDTPAIITVSDLKNVQGRVVYELFFWATLFSDMLVELENRNATTLATFLGIGRRQQTDCKFVNPEPYPDIEPRLFIACLDANQRYNLSTYDSWVTHANILVNESQYLGEAWAAGTSIGCYKLAIQPPKSQIFEGYPAANRTSNPLLFISTTLDPVTPLRAAEKMVKRFGGARLLVQDSVGHTSTSSVSKCTYRYMSKYFASGELPDVGTHCENDKVPFRDEPRASSSLQKRGIPGF
jgi:pimeloyl-ACP methyl ester carboxylesterase